MGNATAQTQSTRTGKQYVRTFLFSMRLGAPLSQLHVLTKFAGIVILSFVVIRVMNEKNPDPIMAGLLFLLSLLTLYLGGVTRWLFRSYLVIVFPMFLFLFITWVVFTPDPGQHIFISWPVYNGKLNIGLSAASGLFILVAVIHYLLTKKFARGIFIGLLIAFLVAAFTTNPKVTLYSFSFLSPYMFILSDKNTLVAGTKVLGYAAMVFMSLMLVMTTRDNELTAALRQVRMPYIGRFFLSIVFRTLSLSLMDFETIRQAQIARGVSVRQKNIFAVLRDMALISIPMVATMLHRSSEIGDALQVRGFSLKRTGQEFLEVQPFRILDGLVLLVLVGLTIAIFAVHMNLYSYITHG